MGYARPTYQDFPPGSPKEIARFQELQAKLAGMFRVVVEDENSPHTAVIVPSLSLPQGELKKISGASFYEERLLCMLMLLRQPRMRIVLVTSQPIHPTIIDYYLHLLAGVPATHARRRLVLLSTFDASPRPLTEKVLERGSLMTQLQKVIHDTEASHLVCFNSTHLERTLAVQLGIPLYSCDPALLSWGTKSGSRRIFREAGVNLPSGFEDLHTSEEICRSLLALWKEDPALRRAVVKLNEGFSGEGNALFDFSPALVDQLNSATSDTDRLPMIERSLSDLRFENAQESWPNFARSFRQMGGIVEAFISGEIKASPSVQCRVNPVGEPLAISTHDQILGGPGGQVFLGCEFPAFDEYRLLIQGQGNLVAKALASKGVIGRFAVDFITVKDTSTGEWEPYGIEINLRKGGTTHPFLMLKFLTDGTYDEETGIFSAPSGLAKYYVASDNFAHRSYRGLRPDDLVDIAVYHGLHFDATSESGVVFHLIGSLSQYGKTGITCIGNTLEEAKMFYQRTLDVLNLETQSEGINKRIETL